MNWAEREYLSTLRHFHVSGHSLTARPMPDYLAALLSTRNAGVTWSETHLAGSSIRQRNALPGTKSPSDFLLITEQHGVLGSLAWHDTRGELRNALASFRIVSPQAPAFFYVPWLGVDDMKAPDRWIAYERAATPVWGCVILDANKRRKTDAVGPPIRLIPVNLALAEWVEVAGTEGMFQDDVHLTSRGNYLAALVVYFSIAGPESAVASTREPGFAPPGLSIQQVAQMVEFAREFAATWPRRVPQMTSRECNAFLDASFQEDFWKYFHRTQPRASFGPLAWWRQWRLARSTAEFRFSEP
jgi:hypothetical protein